MKNILDSHLIDIINHSYRTLAEYLELSQTRANNLIRKYIKNEDL